MEQIGSILINGHHPEIWLDDLKRFIAVRPRKFYHSVQRLGSQIFLSYRFDTNDRMIGVDTYDIEEDRLESCHRLIQTEHAVQKSCICPISSSDIMTLIITDSVMRDEAIVEVQMLNRLSGAATVILQQKIPASYKECNIQKINQGKEVRIIIDQILILLKKNSQQNWVLDYIKRPSESSEVSKYLLSVTDIGELIKMGFQLPLTPESFHQQLKERMTA